MVFGWWEPSDHALVIISLVVAIIGLIVAVLVVPEIFKWLVRRFKIALPFLPISLLLGFCIVMVVAMTAFMHLGLDDYPLLIVSYLCLICAIALCYTNFAAPRLPRINILAWQGWELLDNHVGSLSGWPWTRFTTLYYFRGISSTTELYDKRRTPFDIIILDAERLAAINDQTTQNLATLSTDVPRKYPKLLDRVLLTAEGRLPPGKMKYGIPVRFGFNEVLYSKEIDYYFQGDGLPTIAKLNLADMHRWAKEQNVHLRLLFWDWSLPTLCTLLSAYKAAETFRQNPSDIYSLSEVYKLDEAEIRKLSSAIQQDLHLFKDSAYRVGQVEVLQELLEHGDQNVYDVIIGFGSMAVCNNKKGLLALIPREGVLTWVEFASLIVSSRLKKAEKVISKVILSLATQSRLFVSHAPRGLPATEEAYDHCASCKGQPLIMSTAAEMEKNPSIPLVMRRLPGHQATRVTPHGAAISEVWDEAWDLLRRELKNPPGRT